MMLFILVQLVFFPQYVVSDYDIRMQRSWDYPADNNFPVYWNVPTFMCHKYGINFSEYTKRFGILANEGDKFRGKRIQIFYDVGAFPAMLKGLNNRMVERNGGIPQRGNITMHLERVRQVIDELMDPNHSEPAIIDFEAYRPQYRQNWNEQEIYRKMSTEDVCQKHPQWEHTKCEKIGKSNFERGARVFFEKTCQFLQQIRPKALWGYYGFPYCYNYRDSNGNNPSCSKEVQRENNQIQWLFDASSALYPSLYLSKAGNYSTKKFVIGRMNEACRMAFRSAPADIPKIYPYIWYRDYNKAEFLSENDIYTILETVRKYKVGGSIIWGSSSDLNTQKKCENVLSYLINVLGPVVQRVKRNSHVKYDLPSDDEEIDIISFSGPKAPLGNPKENEAIYQYDTGNESSIKNEHVSSVSSPKVVIYSAIGPNGTKTIYQYENAYPQIQPAKPQVVQHYSTPKSIETTTPRHVRALKDPTPLLSAYMRGFDNTVMRILKNWFKTK